MHAGSQAQTHRLLFVVNWTIGIYKNRYSGKYTFIFLVAFIAYHFHIHIYVLHNWIIILPFTESSRVDVGFDVEEGLTVITRLLTALLSLVEEVNDRVLASVVNRKQFTNNCTCIHINWIN